MRDSAINSLVEIYRHVGEKVRVDLSKKGIPSSRLVVLAFLVAQRCLTGQCHWLGHNKMCNKKCPTTPHLFFLMSIKAVRKLKPPASLPTSAGYFDLIFQEMMINN